MDTHDNQGTRISGKLSSPKVWLPVLAAVCLTFTAAALGRPAPTSTTSIAPPAITKSNSAQLTRPPRVIAAYGDQYLVRAAGGSCTLHAVMEVSGDGGTTWHELNKDTQARLGSVFALGMSSPARGTLLGYDNRTCETQQAHTVSGAVTWERAPAVTLESYFDPRHPDMITLAGAEVGLPCTASHASTDGATIAASCDNSSVHVSRDSGKSWDFPFHIPGASAVAVSIDAVSVVVLDPACSGISIASIRVDEDLQQGPCLPLSGTLDARTTAVHQDDQRLVVWAGEHVVTSADAGLTWD